MKDVEAAVLSVKNGWENSENRIAGFSMLLKQERAVGQQLGISAADSTPKFLWSAKMRFRRRLQPTGWRSGSGSVVFWC
ncbi:MAG: hypothetical protein II863_05515 [Kiritimatiellae bacterium]|nr:hypothetical protein [Kiritimatiellia bacterium]